MRKYLMKEQQNGIRKKKTTHKNMKAFFKEKRLIYNIVSIWKHIHRKRENKGLKPYYPEMLIINSFIFLCYL